jgi:hypothetical protein
MNDRPKASPVEIEKFLRDFSDKFNTYINSVSSVYFTYKYNEDDDDDDDDDDEEFMAMFKIDDPTSILSRLKERCDEINKEEASSDKEAETLKKLKELCKDDSDLSKSFDVILNIKQVQSLKKQGYFKAMISEVEKICEKKNINLLISQINDDFAIMLKKNGYYIMRKNADINAIKIFQDAKKTLKRKRDEEDKAELEAKRKKIELEELEKIKNENIDAICLEPLMNGDTIKRLLCGHAFHKDCLKELIKKQHKKECPICKKIFNIDNNNIKVKTSTNPSDFIQYKEPNSSKKSDGKRKRKSIRKSIRKSKRKSIRKSIRKSKRRSKRRSIRKSKRKSKRKLFFT